MTNTFFQAHYANRTIASMTTQIATINKEIQKRREAGPGISGQEAVHTHEGRKHEALEGDEG